MRLDCQGDPGITFFTVPPGFDIAVDEPTESWFWVKIPAVTQ